MSAYRAHLTNTNDDHPIDAARSVPVSEGLREALAGLRDHGYQPMYNGRPSCPFCRNFIDDEETHRPTCVLLRG